MSPAAVVFMALAWGGVISLCVWCIWRMISCPAQRNADEVSSKDSIKT